ncbi:TIM-barrel domain-containing protein, partial [Herbidospora sp. RD11066]
MTIIDPHLFANDSNYTVANLFKEKKLVVQKPSGEDFHGFCWPGPSVYPDFCSPEARAEWAKLFDFKAYPGRPAELYTWNDMNEPS